MLPAVLCQVVSPGNIAGLQVFQWSRIGRLKRTKFPSLKGGGHTFGGGAGAGALACIAGRLLCDTYLSARCVAASCRMANKAFACLQELLTTDCEVSSNAPGSLGWRAGSSLCCV